MIGPESVLQRSICRYLDVSCPQVVYWHTPNSTVMSGFITGLCIRVYGDVRGRSIAKSTISRFVEFLKGIGMRPGVPDLTLNYAPAKVLYVELKSATGRLSDEQKEMHPRLSGMGFAVAVVRSIDEMKAAIKEHGVPCRDAFLSVAALACLWVL